MYLVLGAVGYAFVLAALALGAHFAARVGARALRIQPFHWFEWLPARGAAWQRFGVRAISTFGALFVACALALFGIWARGDDVPTLRVDVLPESPAQAAGMLNGDQVLTLDGRSLRDFDDLRERVRLGTGDKRLEIERQGQRLTLTVTPRDGRIGVTTRIEQRSISAGTAFSRALSAPFTVPSAALQSAFRESRQKAALMGPVAIVKSVDSRSAQGASLYLLSLLGCSLWTWVAALHLFDGCATWLFRLTHPFAASVDPTILEVARLARMRQSLLLAAGLLVLYGLFKLLYETPFGAGALLGVWLTMPGAIAGTLLSAFVARVRWGIGPAVVVLLACTGIPGAALVCAIWSVFWLKGELARRGYVASWFVTTPRAPQL
ncbi:MAG: PDZ domain-containing protein [Polyangiaceae bacterium]